MAPRPFITVLASWLLVLSLCATAAQAAGPNMAVVVGEESYRTLRIEVTGPIDPRTDAWEVWFANREFSRLDEAEFHSLVRRGDTSGLTRPAVGAAYDECRVDGDMAHRDEQGRPVISSQATRWSCDLTGMTPGQVQWIAVVPVDAAGTPLLDVNALQPVAGRTDVPDVRTPPPDSRPVTYALGAIVLSAIALLSFLRWQDAKRGRTRARLAHLYVAPGIIALAGLTFYPILYGIWLAFTDADQSHLGDTAFIGLQNFVEVFKTPGIWRVTAFTFIWSIANVTFHVLLGLVLALALNRPGLKGKTVYRTILLLPWAIPGYISVLAWNGMLQPDGLINGMLGTQIDFLADAGRARVVVILVNIWLGVPFMMASFSGALQALGKDMFEAAEVDGVSRWDQLIHLTLPNLKATMVPVSLLGFIWSFNAFNTIYLLSRGGPYVGFGEPGATDILVTYVFEVAFTYGHYGLAAAWSVLIFLMLVGFSWTYLRQTRATEAAA
ncbi:MAG: sugar ABC transporter permease [Pseudomonadota bacterium]